MEKETTANPPRGDIKEQQNAFDEFVQEYNFERPDEALEQKTPASFYHLSLRPYPVKVPKVEYTHDVIVRQVRHNGEIKWKGKLIYVSEALAGEPVALKQKEEHLWEIRFSFYPLGVLNELTGEIMSYRVSKGEKCYLCARSKMLPMSPVAHGQVPT